MTHMDFDHLDEELTFRHEVVCALNHAPLSWYMAVDVAHLLTLVNDRWEDDDRLFEDEDYTLDVLNRIASTLHDIALHEPEEIRESMVYDEYVGRHEHVWRVA